MKTNIYIDGFNLYYGALKGTPYKWLNLAEMCRLMLASYNVIHEIKYFTARVKARPHDPDQPIRQETYLRALRTLPNLSIFFGHFLSNACLLPLASPVPGQSVYVKVIRTEEKGSDVNFATHLLRDGFKGEYELAVVITNDSDLQEPIKIVRQELGLKVGMLNPYARASQVLAQHATFVKPIRKGVLAASQFPVVLTDAVGTFRKPASW